MKRLVDRNDPEDEVVRLLIRSGANHQPAPGSKMRLMAALGVGSAVGLSASKVLAWLGTSGGKVALAVSVVGTAAGGAYVMAGSPVTPIAAAPAAATFEQPMFEQPMARAAEPPAAEPILEAPSSERSAPRRTPAQPHEQRTAGRAAPSRRSLPPAQPASVASEARAHRARLSDETIWVDQLRVAAESQDRPAFERLLEQYAERFPEGQLHPEVNRLRTSLR
jgi:hypothetical protein